MDTQTTPTRETIFALLHAWINQRPGLDPADYGFPAYSHEAWKEARRNYTSESRKITTQKHEAETLLRAVENTQISAQDLLQATRAFSGRLQITRAKNGEWQIDYCAGQYWPTEYRAAACAVLAQALWDYYREDWSKEAEEKGKTPGDMIRANFRRMFGRTVQTKWFD